MKKLFLTALTGILLVGCTSDESDVKTQERMKIRFDSPVMTLGETKAPGFLGEITGSTYPEAEKFMVYSRVYTGSFNGWDNSTEIQNFWDGAEVASKQADNVYWGTSGAHYWPNDPYKLAFAAYSPSSVLTDHDATSISYDKTGIKIVGFTTKADSDEQYDLMYSTRNVDCDKVNCLSGVPVKFNHALSSIVFGAMENQDGKSYKITKLVLTGSFVVKGDFAENITEIPGTPYSETSNPAWTNPGTPTAQIYEPSFTAFDVQESVTLFTSGSSAVLPIPQTAPADATVKLTYKVTQSGSTLEYEKDIKLSEFLDHTNNPITKWEIGKRYKYIINFGGTSKIYFKPSVTDWVDGGTAQVTI